MKAALTAFVVFVGFAPLLQGQPYGIDRRELNEPFLNHKLPNTARGALPLKLSQTGAFERTSDLKPMRTLIPYTVNAPLWSDAAGKRRWLFVPKDAKIGYSETNWSFPVGTVFVKHFDLVTNEKTGESRRLETRFLVVDADKGVYGLTYKWKADNSDADLLAADGLDEDITITGADGATRTQKWRYPSRDQCLECHTKESGGIQNKGVLGVKTAQQNGNFAYPQPNGGTVTDNQLRTMNHIGLFEPAIDEGNIAKLPKMADLGDGSATLELRVRSYLDANCAHCHQPNGEGEFDGRFSTPFEKQDIANGRKRVIFKDPDKSRILVRDASNDSPMPPLARRLVHEAWTNLLTGWILNAFNPISANGDATGEKVTVSFNAKPEAASAGDTANYKLEGGGVTHALTFSAFDGDARTVTFSVAPGLTAGVAYKVTVNNVLDDATPQNRSWPDRVLDFVAIGGFLGPANDDYFAATMIPGQDAVELGANCTATNEVNEPAHAGNSGGHSVWWSWTAPSGEPVTLDTHGSSFDTLLAVYTGSSVSSASPVAANDDVGADLTSQLTFNPIPGTTYHIAVDGYNGACGDIVLNLHQGPAPQSPANDMFSNAILLSGNNGSASGANHFAGKEPAEPHHAHNSGGASVWWMWTAPGDGMLTIDTAGSSFDTTLAAYVGSDVANLMFVEQNDDEGSLVTSRMEFQVAAGVTYHIAVDGYYGRMGDIVLNYSFNAEPLLLRSKILRVEINDDELVLDLVGPAGAVVELESSADLIRWIPAGRHVLTGRRLTIPKPVSTGSEPRFYRAVRK